ELHIVFKLLIPFLGAVGTAQIYLFCRRIIDVEEVCIFSSLAYGMWAAYGSLDYSRWGGLPNCLAMVFVMALLTLLIEESWSHRSTILLALLFAATFLTHHHVMVTAGCVLVVLAVFFLVRGSKAKFTGIGIGLTGSVLLGCFYIVPYALK